MKKIFKLNKAKTESYCNIILSDNYIKLNDIFSIEILSELNIAHDEYQISYYVIVKKMTIFI